jgi:hypothetical protein
VHLFFLKAKDGSVISGRTQEFCSNLESMIEMVPREKSFATMGPEGAEAVSWKTRHGFVGILACPVKPLVLLFHRGARPYFGCGYAASGFSFTV